MVEVLKNTRVCAGAFFLLTVLLFYPAASFQFLTYDDSIYVVHNKYVKQGVNGETVRWAFTGTHAAMWHPLTSLSHLVDVEFFGMNPRAHHLVNIILHAVNAVLLYWWLVIVFNLPVRALIVAAIFAWHPLRVESVAWVAERKDILCTLGCLLTLHAYTRYVRQPGRKTYLTAIFGFALAVMAKPMSVMLPIVLLLLDGWPFKRLGVEFAEAGNGVRSDWRVLRQRLLEKIPFFCLSLFLAAITYKAQHEGEVLKMMETTSWIDRAGNALVSYVRYLGLLLWPVDLAVLYPHPGRWPVHIVATALVVLAGISYGCWQVRRTQPWWLLGWGWFLIALLPVIGLVQAGGAALANRYTYLSTVGLLLAAVWSLAGWVSQAPVTRRKPAGAVLCAIMISCVWLTRMALPFWQDTETLFRETIRATKPNAVAYLVLSEALLDKKRPQEALPEALKAIELSPEDGRGYLLAGRIYVEVNQPDMAMTALENAAKRNMPTDKVEFQMARALRQLGRSEEAKEVWLRYVKKNPDNPNAWNNLGGIQAAQRDFLEAEKSFRKALIADPSLLEPRRNLIRLLSMNNRQAEALKEAETGLRLFPGNHELWFQAGLLHEAAGDAAKARNCFETAIKLSPAWPLPKESLAWLLIQSAQINPAEARQSQVLLDELRQLYGADVPVRVEELQACVLAANSRFTEAIELAQKVRAVLQQQGNQRGVARVDSQMAAFEAKHHWLPGTP